VNCPFATQEVVDELYLGKLRNACLHTNICEAYKGYRTGKNDFYPNRLRFSLKEYAPAIDKYLVSRNISLFEFLISVFSFVISRIFSKNKFSIAYPHSFRTSPTFMSGYAVTVQSMFFDFSFLKTANDLINHVREERSFAKKVGNVLFSSITKSYRKLFPNTSANINIVFSKTFLGKSTDSERSILKSKFITYYKPSIADLIIYYDDSLDFELEWNAQKVCENFASIVIDAYRNVMESFLEDTKNLQLSEINLLSVDQRNDVVHIGSGGSPSYPLMMWNLKKLMKMTLPI
jgi:hypothetical protein